MGGVTSFTLDNVQSQGGKVVIVTGGNAGIGFGVVKGLVSKGATVIVASRNQERVNEAVVKVKKLQPGEKLKACCSISHPSRPLIGSLLK